MIENRKSRRTFTGVVVAAKTSKTISVLVETNRKHSKYSKSVRYSRKFIAHDEEGIANEGDTVIIMETRKLSATKRFRLVSVVNKAISDVELKEEVK
jgi:small subunit ribosomal protein S17